MEYSRYNLFFKYGTLDVAYNILTGNTITSNEQGFEELVKLKDIPSCPIIVTKRLEQGRFVVSSNKDEIEYALQLRREKLLSVRVFKLTINTTYDCNFACTYCVQTHKKSTNISAEVINKIVDIIRCKHKQVHFEILDLDLFGGEPLYNFEGVKKIIDTFRQLGQELGFKITCFITTNGSLITDKVIKLFKDIETTFQISIDGSKERHNQNRPFRNGAPSYEIILVNIEKILNELPLATISLRSNYDRSIEPSHYYELLSVIRRYDKNRIYANLTKIYQESIRKIPYDRLLATVALFNRYSIPVSGYGFVSSFACKFSYQNSLFVDYDGTIRVCSAVGAYEYDETNDIRERTRYLAAIDNLPQKCVECLFVTRCKGPCFRFIGRKACKSNFECDNVIPDEIKMSLFIKQEMIRTINGRKIKEL